MNGLYLLRAAGDRFRLLRPVGRRHDMSALTGPATQPGAARESPTRSAFVAVPAAIYAAGAAGFFAVPVRARGDRGPQYAADDLARSGRRAEGRGSDAVAGDTGTERPGRLVSHGTSDNGFGRLVWDR